MVGLTGADVYACHGPRDHSRVRSIDGFFVYSGAMLVRLSNNLEIDALGNIRKKPRRSWHSCLVKGSVDGVGLASKMLE